MLHILSLCGNRKQHADSIRDGVISDRKMDRNDSADLFDPIADLIDSYP